MYFGISQLRKIWLDKCLKRRVSQNPETDNMGNGLKHIHNLNRSIFTRFIKHVEGSYVGKSLILEYRKSKDCSLTH